MKKLYKVGLFRLYEQKNKWKWSYIDIFILFVLLIYSEDSLREYWDNWITSVARKRSETTRLQGNIDKDE